MTARWGKASALEPSMQRFDRRESTTKSMGWFSCKRCVSRRPVLKELPASSWPENPYEKNGIGRTFHGLEGILSGQVRQTNVIDTFRFLGRMEADLLTLDAPVLPGWKGPIRPSPSAWAGPGRPGKPRRTDRRARTHDAGWFVRRQRQPAEKPRSTDFMPRFKPPSSGPIEGVPTTYRAIRDGPEIPTSPTWGDIESWSRGG